MGSHGILFKTFSNLLQHFPYILLLFRTFSCFLKPSPTFSHLLPPSAAFFHFPFPGTFLSLKCRVSGHRSLPRVSIVMPICTCLGGYHAREPPQPATRYPSFRRTGPWGPNTSQEEVAEYHAARTSDASVASAVPLIVPRSRRYKRRRLSTDVESVELSTVEHRSGVQTGPSSSNSRSTG